MAKYQLSAIFCEERNAIIEATTKAGKTFGAMAWLLSECLSGGQPGREYWWVAPIFEQTKIAYRRYKTMLREMDPGHTIWKSNDTDPSITFSNSAVLRFKSGDKPDGLYGEDVWAAVVDEGSRVKEDAWYAVRSTVTATRGKLRIIGNVKGRKNWTFSLARRVEAGTMPGWKYAKITCNDAVREGIITQDEVDAARKELPDHVFRELYMAEPSEDGANPFGLQHIAACARASLSRKPPRAFGVDLAKSVDWTVVEGIDEDMNPCVFERWQHEPWDRTSERILSIVGSVPTLVDSTGVGDPIVEGLQRKAPNVEGFKFTNQSKQQLFEGLALKIQGHACGILDGVSRQEHESFEYNTERSRVFYAAAEGCHDDTVCAKALAVERARGYVPVSAGFVYHAQEPPPPDPRPIEVIIKEKQQQDPNWGWEPIDGRMDRYRRF